MAVITISVNKQIKKCFIVILYEAFYTGYYMTHYAGLGLDDCLILETDFVILLIVSKSGLY